MAATSLAPARAHAPLPPLLEAQKVVEQFQHLMRTDRIFRKEIETLLSENYLGFIYQDNVIKRPVWITPKKKCYPIFFKHVISKSLRNNKVWVWAVDVAKKKPLALARTSQKHPFWMYPKTWNNYVFVTENQIGPKCLGFYTTRRLLPHGLMLSTCYFLQPKYDGSLRDFINAKQKEHREDEQKLRSIANFLTAQMIFEVGRLNDKNIVHRDIKPDNFLINGIKTLCPNLKLTDMEFSCAPGTSLSCAGSKECISPQYAAEVKYRRTFTVSILNDAWALGIAILKMRACFGLSKKYDFVMNVKLEKHITINKIYALLDDPDWISAFEPEDPFEKAMCRLLCVSETERWTASQARDFIAPHAPQSF